MVDLLGGGEFACRAGRGWSACTARGPGRAQNADAYAVRVESDVISFAVADGVSSLPQSELASRAAARAAVGVREAGFSDVAIMVDQLNRAVGEALQGQSRSGATTLAAATVSSDGVRLLSIGDSEVLGVTDRGPAERLNAIDRIPMDDHVLLAWIDGEFAFEPHMRHLLQPPPFLCLATDGLSQALRYDIIADVVRANPVEAGARALVRAARDAGARDDVTVVLFGLRGEHAIGERR